MTPRSFHRAIALAGALALSALTGCATSGAAGKEERVVWPPPPETARIEFVRAFSREEDLSRSAWRETFRALVPTGSDAVVVQPTGLALSPDEKLLYVVSSGRIVEVDLAANRMRSVGPSGKDRLGLSFGAAMDAAGNLYVTDRAKNMVAVLDRQMKVVRRIGEGKLDQPTGIAIDRKRERLYVTAGADRDVQTHRIEVFTLEGEHLRTIGKRGDAPGEFNFPTNLAVDGEGTLYVVDTLNFRVQLFDPEGQLVGMFGAAGVKQAGKFDKAKSVALDAFGNVYVADSAQAVVQIFNRKFQPLLVFGGRATQPHPGRILLPTMIVIDSRNTIYVADLGWSRVSEYRLVNTTAADSEGVAAPPPSPAP